MCVWIPRGEKKTQSLFFWGVPQHNFNRGRFVNHRSTLGHCAGLDVELREHGLRLSSLNALLQMVEGDKRFLSIASRQKVS